MNADTLAAIGILLSGIDLLFPASHTLRADLLGASKKMLHQALPSVVCVF